MQNKTKNKPFIQQTNRSTTNILVIGFGIILLLFIAIASILVGAEETDFQTLLDALLEFHPQLQKHQIIMELRIPRTLGAAIVGCCFAVSGAIMQGMTRNPLADSGLLGLNAGAVFVLSLCLAFVPNTPYPYIILLSFLGAAIGSGMVYGIGSLSRSGLTPIRLVLSGAAVSAFLSALSEGISLYYQTAQDLAFWYASGLAGTRWEQLKIVGPWLLVVTIGAILISRSLTLLSLGEETAVGLGSKLKLVQLVCIVIVLILAGVAVSVVGAVSFVGLIVPHVARRIMGHDYRWIIPASAIFGAILVISADIVSRTWNPPYETPIGAIIALIGVPFFLYLARKGGTHNVGT